MTDNSNSSSHQESMNSSFHHPRMVSFQSAAVDSSTGMTPGEIPHLEGKSSLASMLMYAENGMISHMDTAIPARYPAGSVRESMSRFKHVSGSPAYWFPEEVEILNRGLIKFANEASLQKYTKIAFMLPWKTIRDVALRCQWMINKENGKRRKLEEYYAAKKMKDTKEKMVVSSSTENAHLAPNSLRLHHMNINDQLPSEVSTLDAEMKSLLDKNEAVIREISRNLQGGMIQANANLFHYMRNNIAALENRVNVMSRGVNQFPGSMRQMPPLPAAVNDELLSNLIPHNPNAIGATPGSSHLQLGPACFRHNIG